MRIRHDVVLVSCVLFTIALVCVIPPVWNYVLAGYGDLRGLDPDMRELARSDSVIGKLSLALILIGLIVTWTGYINKVRWTWFVMFILVSGLAIPFGIWPLVVHPQWVVEGVYDLILEAAGKNPVTTIPRDLVWWGFFYPILIFLLMAIALLLPVKSFFFRRTGPTMRSHL